MNSPNYAAPRHILHDNPDLKQWADSRETALVVATAIHSLIGDNAGTLLVEAPLGFPDVDGNLIGSAAGSGIIDPLLGPLANNGGPTQTHALLSGSPALDAGDPATETFTYTITDSQNATDQAVLTFNITGTNDAPVAVAETNATTLVEAGGVDNATPGTAQALGNVLDNDSDVDAADVLGTWVTETDDAAAAEAGAGATQRGVT